MLPQAFIGSLIRSIGKSNTDIYLEALCNQPTISVRRNPFKISEGDFEDLFGSDKVKWAADGLYLNYRPSFTLDPLFHSGAYYVQEASSMYVGTIVSKLLNGIEKPKVLDLCAAPGGKSTDILSKLSDDAILVSNEPIGSRASILAENIAKWGRANVLVSNNDPADFSVLPNYFDIILVDAPCSGEGMFRKDSNAIEQWSEENVKLCSSRQKRILHDIWTALKPGGFLLYSTCTFNKFENDGNIDWMLSNFDARMVNLEKPSEALSTESGGIQFVPGISRGEGFFICAFQKNELSDEPYIAKSNIKIPLCTKSIQYDNYISGDYVSVLKGDLIKCYPTVNYEQMAFIESRIRVIHSAIAVTIQKGKDFVPQADLALSTDVNKDRFPVCELTIEKAIAFLSKDNLLLPDMQKGYILLTFHHIPIGFVKNLGNRTNNLHPISRRIRQQNFK